MGIENPVVESVENLKVDPCSVLDAKDPAFVVEPEFRPQTKHDEFIIEALEDQIPVIDLSPLQNKDEQGLQKVVNEIGKAAEEWGFFQVVNHGVPLSLIETLHKEVLAFFSLPLEEKNKIVRTFEQPVGYYHQELTKNRRDWKEVFDFLVKNSVSYPTSDYSTVYTVTSKWPKEPAGLRDACQKYAKATEALALELLSLLSRSLGLQPNYFHEHFVNNTATIRCNYYPPCPIPDLALGVSRHKDPSAITLLVQDETGGLQVKRNGEWIGLRPRREAFVVNLGDIFQVWSNDRFHSVEHRVVVNKDKARLSFPLFLNPDYKSDVKPTPELCDESHPPKYRPYNYGYFKRKRNEGNYRQDGRNIQIDDFAINRD